MPIDIETKIQAGVPVIQISGELGEAEGLELIHAANQALNAPGDRTVIDMNAMLTITSGGLGALVRIQAQTNTQEQTVVFAAAQPFVRDILQMTRLDTFLKLADSVEAALASLK